MRTSEIVRKTAETDIRLTLNLDGEGKSEINSGCGFLDHMLTLFSKHAGYDLSVVCKGDKEVDFHHTTEDIGISLGKAFFQALGDKKGIYRYGDIVLPMDETLIMTAVDISGRDYLGIELDIPAEKVGDFDTELCEEFWLA
ncbi:MAG: imidazoleglycerol-phosphate dehydratase, partial [Clostridia bacterium]|nr:imidazoleglycerol-phosphate dehydratase [Clostridia bacterium]